MSNECSVNISLLNKIISDSLIAANGGQTQTIKSISCKLDNCENIEIKEGLVLIFKGEKLDSVEVHDDISEMISKLKKETNEDKNIGLRILYDIKFEDNPEKILFFIRDYIKIALNIK